MRTGKAFLLIFCLIVMTTCPGFAVQNNPVGPDSLTTVQRTIMLYETGQFAEAEFIALKALENPDKLTRFERFDLYKVLAFCAVANDDEVNAKRHFIQALRLNPNLSPDPITWSPKVRQVFDLARRDYLELAAEETRYKIAMEAEICRNASLKSLYLPGFGQMDKGEPVRGIIYGAVFWTAAAVFIYAQVELPAARKSYRDAVDRERINDKWEQYRNLYQLRNGAAYMMTLTYTVTFLDALWRKPAEGKVKLQSP